MLVKREKNGSKWRRRDDEKVDTSKRVNPDLELLYVGE